MTLLYKYAIILENGFVQIHKQIKSFRMRKVFLLAIVFATTTAMLSSCKKEIPSTLLPNGTVTTMQWGSQDFTDIFIYSDDGQKKIEINQSGTSVIRTNNAEKTFHSFKMEAIGADNYKITFDDGNIVVSQNIEKMFPYGIDWKNEVTTGGYYPSSEPTGSVTTKTFSIQELDGVYRFSKNGTNCKLEQLSGKHKELMIISYIAN